MKALRIGIIYSLWQGLWFFKDEILTFQCHSSYFTQSVTYCRDTEDEQGCCCLRKDVGAIINK
jgi:hypothetical protein